MRVARVVSLLLHDARLQWRYGIYGAYGIVIGLYVALLAWGASRLPASLPGIIIFSDPAALGFFFLGALMMLERSEGVRAALAVSPLSPREYLFGKMVTLTTVALVACAILSVTTRTPRRPVLLLAAVAFTSIQYIGIGVPIALRFKSVTSYLIGSAGFLAPIVVPGALALFDPIPLWMLAIPAVAQLRLILVATGAMPASPTTIVLMMTVLALTAIGATRLALTALTKEFGGP